MVTEGSGGWKLFIGKVLVAIAILHVKGEESVKIKISGIGKYPYLDINTKKIDFETLLVGKKKVEIKIKSQKK